MARRGSQAAGRGSARSEARAPRRPGLLLPVLLLLGIAAAGWAGTPPERRPFTGSGPLETLRRVFRSEGEPVHGPPLVEIWIDPADLSFDGLLERGADLDPRWVDELELVAGSFPPFRLEDVAAREELRSGLEEISFVRSVPVLEVDPTLGLWLELELRAPVACVPVGVAFLPVDAEGVLLSGAWTTPLRVDGLPLPVLGPMEEARGLFALARPGDWLEEPEHLDALDVALSLAEHLSREARIALGRVVVDATRGRLASAREPGVRLALEDRRLVLFGRPPSTEEPGELPVERKWAALEDALLALASEGSRRLGGAVDWSVVDVRWDHPELVPRGPWVAALEPVDERADEAAGRGARGAGAGLATRGPRTVAGEPPLDAARVR